MIPSAGTWWHMHAPSVGESAQCAQCKHWFVVHRKVGDSWTCSTCSGLSS